MIKKIILFSGICIAACLLALHLQKTVVNSAVTPNEMTTQPVIVSNIPPKPAAKVVFTPAKSNIQTKSATPAEPKTAEEAKGDAEKEKYRLLGELRELAAKDPQGALAQAMKWPAGDDRNKALEAVCFGMAQTDPAEAVKMAKTLHLDEQSGAIMENLVLQWAKTDVSSALEWTKGQPAGEQRDAFTTRIAYSMSQSDPAGAARLVIDQIPPGTAQEEAVMSVLHQWGNQNPTAAANWVNDFPASPLRERAIKELEGITRQQQAMANQ